MDDPIKRIHQQNVERVQANLDATRHTDNIEHLQSIESTVVGVVSKLVDFLEGNISRTEVVNQVRSVATPDVQKVVDAVVELGVITHSNRIDLSPLKDGLKELSEKLDKLPTDFPDAPKSLEVSNLKDIEFPEDKEVDLEPVIKAIQKIKMVAEAPNIQVDAPNLEPIKKGLTDVVKSIKDIKYPEIPKTDLSKVEKKLDAGNKLLKTISEKRFGGGGGGGESTLAFPLYANITTDISTPGTIIETDGVKTLTTTITSTSITEVWS